MYTRADFELSPHRIKVPGSTKLKLKKDYWMVFLFIFNITWLRVWLLECVNRHVDMLNEVK